MTGCKFSHELDSNHNAGLLRVYKLESLSRAELCTLLLQSEDWLLPDICCHYNNDGGEFGLCQEGFACKRLHICERFLNHDCSCSKTRDFNAPQPYKSLQEKGVPEDFTHSLKSVYANIFALKYTDRKQPNSSTREFSANPDGPNRRQRPRPVRDKTEICMFFIKGHCMDEDRCFKAHDKMPYRWEVKEDEQWTALTDNVAIEKYYCDPKNTHRYSLLTFRDLFSFDILRNVLIHFCAKS
ncbi:protein mono-ADP-ribosyltransferase PARP12-like [Perca flavescens]|uniref:protein mono-ADP-ribosyltransferase PARP12-like n=1 Tax=Perca flavescens TaxID=8167 RepID=UPI00106EA5D7|nr:protein mono-ADP-ribosyltransferase PARP12-like [Perca flavescens]